MSNTQNLDDLQFRPAVLRCNRSRWYVEFYAWCPDQRRLRRKTVKVNHIADRRERRRYGEDLARRITDKLYSGWNPWIDQQAAGYHRPLVDGLAEFRRVKFAEYAADSVRVFRQRLDLFESWLQQQGLQRLPAGSFSRAQAFQFMDQVAAARARSPRTYNNYRAEMVTVFEFLQKRGWVKDNVFLSVERRRSQAKKRRPLTDEERRRLAAWLLRHDPAFHIVCLLLYSCKIRRTELTKLRIKDIDLQAGTITVPAYDSQGRNIAKTHKARTVVIPDAVRPYFDRVGYEKLPAAFYLVSMDGFGPGPRPVTWANRLTEHFRRIADGLGFPKWAVSLYSLKDTGIMRDLIDGVPVHAARDQAGHQDISETNKYLPPVPASLEIVRRQAGDMGE